MGGGFPKNAVVLIPKLSRTFCSQFRSDDANTYHFLLTCRSHVAQPLVSAARCRSGLQIRSLSSSNLEHNAQITLHFCDNNRPN